MACFSMIGPYWLCVRYHQTSAQGLKSSPVTLSSWKVRNVRIFYNLKAENHIFIILGHDAGKSRSRTLTREKIAPL